ncbi:MAG: sulfatase [Planctomycetaceae bacterium]|nr:sulfatase [Planctomycetaceae bacterium]
MRYLPILFVAVLAPAVFGKACLADDAATPNIVLILSDDQGWTDYGFMGHDAIRTPHLDRLAEQSVVFRRGYVPTALCRPSLMTLATGHYAHRHGVTGNDPSPKYADPKSDLYAERRAKLISYIDQFDTLPELLVARGYLCHQSGKWWEGSYQHGGFTHGMTRGFPEPGGRHGDDGLKIGREGMEPVTQFVDMAVEQKKPFFLWYAPFLPHSPHNPPERLLKKYEQEGRPLPIARYDAMCEWFDETCGELLGYLDKKGVRENTLVVYVTDNGWIQSPDKPGYAPRSKQTPYEGGVRTPIMFSWPDKLKPADRPELASSIDLVPTILAAAGARIPRDLPGLNLLPNLESGKKIDRDAIFGEGFAHDIADIAKPEASLLYRWCIEGKWKLLLTYDGEVNRYQSTHPRTEKGPQLFDLLADPSEETNVAAEHPDVVARLAKRIADWYPVTERKTQTTVSQ